MHGLAAARLGRLARDPEPLFALGCQHRNRFGRHYGTRSARLTSLPTASIGLPIRLCRALRPAALATGLTSIRGDPGLAPSPARVAGSGVAVGTAMRRRTMVSTVIHRVMISVVVPVETLADDEPPDRTQHRGHDSTVTLSQVRADQPPDRRTDDPASAQRMSVMMPTVTMMAAVSRGPRMAMMGSAMHVVVTRPVRRDQVRPAVAVVPMRRPTAVSMYHGVMTYCPVSPVMVSPVAMVMARMVTPMVPALVSMSPDTIAVAIAEYDVHAATHMSAPMGHRRRRGANRTQGDRRTAGGEAQKTQDAWLQLSHHSHGSTL